MEVREVDLPGVGKKFAIRTNEDDRLTVIIHNTGHRELYNFKPGEDFPFHAVRLDDEEARKLSAILGGAFFQPAVAENVEMVLGQLSIEWVKINSTSSLLGRTLAEMDIRRQTGASIIAILRGGRALPNPQPEERINSGDTLMVIGSREQVDQFLAFSRGEGR